MQLSVRAALLVCFFTTAASVHLEEIEVKEQSSRDTQRTEVEHEKTDDAQESARRATNLEPETDNLRVAASHDLDQAHDTDSVQMANRTGKAAHVFNEGGDRLDRNGNAENVKHQKGQDAVAKAAKNLTAAPETAPRRSADSSAKGDPHLVNMLGQRFDIHRSGEHLLIQIPKQMSMKRFQIHNMLLRQATLLRVLGTVERSGDSCADMYFTSINITGHWASLAEGYHFSVRDFIVKDEMSWTRFGPLSLKVVHGRTNEGIQYLNLFVKNLGRVRYSVGGLMGEDDHTHASTPASDCMRAVDI